MTEYRCHWWLPGERPSATAAVALEAESIRHGAALALRHFIHSGCEIGIPLAHIDVTEGSGVQHTMLVEEILDWLRDPGQAEFVRREGLSELVH